MSNALKRIISGVIFFILIVGAILLHQYSFALLFVIVTGLALHEFHKLTNKPGNIDVNPTLAIIGGSILFCSFYLYQSGICNHKEIFLIYGLYIIFIILSELFRKKEQPIQNWAYFFLGQIYIALPFSLLNSILFIQGYQPLVLLAVFLTIWINDTGAYVVGMTLGKHRLFERISPKKSWEGFFGGAVFAIAASYLFFRFIPQITDTGLNMSFVQWLLFTQIIVIFGTLGDLTESLLKRTLQVKDSGNMIPGHGGILDRFDSMLLAAPVIFIYLQIILMIN